MAPAPFSIDRQTFRATVAQVAEKARAILPTQVNGRIEAAVKLVLAGDVEPLDDGTIRVGSSEPTRWYHLQGPTCTCTDFTQGKAPQGWCKHRIAAGIDKRVRELLPPAPAPAPAVAPALLPEAPASANCHIMIAGRQVQITLRDSDETRLLQRLTAVLAQFPGEATPPPQAQYHGESWCHKHNCAMQQTTKSGRSWWSHRTDQGWCKGR